MKVVTYVVVLLTLVMVTSCTPANQISNEDYHFAVSSPIDQYALAMSSQPGLPIEASTEVIKEGLALKVHYFCTEGQFLTNDGEILLLGDSIYQAFEDHTIYWIPWEEETDLLSSSENGTTIEVHIDVLEEDSDQVVASSMHIIYEKDFWYSFDRMPMEPGSGSFPIEDKMDILQKAYNKDPYVYAKETDAYDAIIGRGKETIAYCQEALTDEVLSKNKDFYTWVISQTIRQNFPEDLTIGRQVAFETTTKSDCHTYALVGDATMVWSDLKKDTLIQISEMLSMDYFMGHRIPEAFAEDQDDLDQVDFIIRRQDMTQTFDMEVMGFQVPRLSYIEDYQLIAITDQPPVVDPGGHSYTEIPVYDQPDGSATFIGYVYGGDLLKYATDDEGQRIQSGDWSLVNIIPYAWCINSNTCWIANEHIAEVTEETHANAGYVLAGTKYYTEPDLASGPLDPDDSDDLKSLDPFRQGDVYCVRILGEEGDFYWISDEVNGMVHGYVLKEDLIFYVDEDLLERLRTFTPDLDKFMERIRTKIMSGQATLRSLDWDMDYELSGDQRSVLAGSLRDISHWELFDGGLRPYREAAYPYISMDLGDGQVIVGEAGQLLVLFDQEAAYDYGLGTRGAPIRFMTPNPEFVQQLMALVEVPDNADPDSLLYLLQAESVEIIRGDQAHGDVYNQQVHMNHALRGLMQVIEGPMEETAIDSYETKYTFRFTMTDGSTMEVIYEDSRIFYQDKCYKARQDVVETVGNMFAGYF